MRKPTLILLLIGVILSATSCKKEAGFGGLSTITGKVYAFDYTPNSGIIEAEGYTANIRVFIGVKNSQQILDEIRTNVNGEFEFDRLRSGTYELWTFTDCDTCTNNETPVLKEVIIETNNEDKELSDFVINI